jgi:hypothetical protein
VQQPEPLMKLIGKDLARIGDARGSVEDVAIELIENAVESMEADADIY